MPALRAGERVRLITRNGHDWGERFPAVTKALELVEVKSCLIDGELVVCDENGLTVLAFNPSTGDLYTLVQERDGLGDRLVPDFMTRVQQGAFYGWPYAYIGQHPQPGFAQLRPDKVKASVPPDLLFEAQSSTTSYFMRAQQDPRKARHRLLGLSRITPQGAKPA
jgi:hypothetical protein